MTRVTALGVGSKEKKLSWSFLKNCCFGYMSVFMTVLFFGCPSETGEWVSRGLKVCAERLVPSLFPFMVVSALLVSSGVGEWLGGLLARPFGALFGVGRQGSAALILGWLCGFPIGARTASRLYSEGKICGSELERIICISGVPSPAFLINAVGVSMLGDVRLGAALYAVCVLSCAIVGIAIKRLGKEDIGEQRLRDISSGRDSAAVAFTRAVSDSTVGMLYVCGFVVFFSAFVGALDAALSAATGRSALTDAAFGFFEITSGLSRLASSSMPQTTVMTLCAATAAWSGLSVHLQVISLCSESDFPVSRYFLSSFFKAAIAALLMLAALPILI